MVVDPEYEGVGREPGLTIWRVEKLKIVPVESRFHGSFYQGDSYIVLKTYKNGESFKWDIHYWLGQKTSQDEAGVAAIKTVELDDYLGGTPVQHREVQLHETKLFLSYFKNGIRYLEGGIATGFRHVVPEHTLRLYEVKGKRNVRLREMPVSVDSMTHGDCFVLDTDSEIFVWNGDQSGRQERLRAIMAANAIRDETHSGRVPIVIIDANEHSMNENEARFFEKMGSGDHTSVSRSRPEPEKEDAAYDRQGKMALYKIWNRGEDIAEELVATSDLTRDMLDSESCFLLDAGQFGLFVWVGRHADQQERAHAMKMGERFISKNDLPGWISLNRVIEHGEPHTFKQFFKTWDQPQSYRQLAKFAAVHPEELPTLNDPTKSRAIVKNLGSACGFLPDDGSGELEVWILEESELANVESSTYGIFFGANCYVIKYRTVGSALIIYLWMGKEISDNDKDEAERCVSKLDLSLDCDSILVRVSQGYEPEHFCRIFKGKMVVLKGRKTDEFQVLQGIRSSEDDIPRLFNIRGTSSYNTRAEQVPAVTKSLDTDDVFVLETAIKNYVWIGKDSSTEEKDLAHNIVPRLSPGKVTDEVDEGLEPPEFWEALGGQAEYSHGRPELIRPQLDPRLFSITKDRDTLHLEEIVDFDMEDLSEEDLMLLDSGDEIYVWIGKSAATTNRTIALEYAEKYLLSGQGGRSVKNTPAVIIKQGMEPESFTSFFRSWNAESPMMSTHL